MATSDSRDFDLDVAEIIEEAYERCGLESRTGYDLKTARRSLNIMFAEWHVLFPSHKQDLNCTSCRKAVCKFWETMVDEWIEIERPPKKTTKKKNGSKKAKAK